MLKEITNNETGDNVSAVSRGHMDKVTETIEITIPHKDMKTDQLTDGQNSLDDTSVRPSKDSATKDYENIVNKLRTSRVSEWSLTWRRHKNVKVLQCLAMETKEVARATILISLACLLCSSKVHAVGCFVCTSLNRGNKHCEDTFNNTANYYHSQCWASRKGRNGQFPATQCIKMVAEDEERGFSLIVRNCVVDDGGTNTETEIGRQSHCGWMRVIKYNGVRMRGCILSCDTDGCNHANAHAKLSMRLLLSSLLIVKLALIYSLTTML